VVEVAQATQVVNIPQHVTESHVTPAPQQAIAVPAQQEKPAVQKETSPAPASVAIHKQLAKKTGGKAKLTLETYTRCVARALDVDEPLAVSVLIQESDARNPMRRGKRGSRGPLQVQPIALEEVGLSRHERSLPILVYGGLRYLKTMMARFDNLQTALAAYNMGPTSLVKRDYRPYRVTQRYVRQVLNRAGKIRAGDVPSYPVLEYPMSHRDLPSRHHKIASLQACLVS
jgi:soluble lytic murein transglycosylase-like protein